MGIGIGTVDFFDYNNDNNMDLLFTGVSNFDGVVAALYKNKGNGVFSIVNNLPFTKVTSSMTAIGDVNNDGYDDIFIAGWDTSYSRVLNLYINTGNGTFIKDTMNYIGISAGSMELVDIDKDNDLDLFVTGDTGYYTNMQKQTFIYLNNGNGVFSPSSNVPFGGFDNCDSKFFDIDGDSDMDLIIAGTENNIGYSTKLYINNGTNGFSVSTQQFQDMSYAHIETTDVDNDNDLDIIISGLGNDAAKKCLLYRNNGSGVFSIDINFNVKIGLGKIKTADIDGDSDNDLIITGRDSSNTLRTEIYLNNGNGIFSLSNQKDLYPASAADIAFADIDNDNDLDLMIEGFVMSGIYYSQLLINDGYGNFTAATGSPFSGYNDGDMDFADIDNDNDMDIIINGNSTHFLVNVVLQYGQTTIYRNDGNNNFVPVTGTPFDSLFRGSVKFVDVNNDNLPDIFLCGQKNNIRHSNLYINTGNGNYSLKTGTSFSPVDYSAVDFADIDGDNDMDMVLCGTTNSSFPSIFVTKLYKNDGTGNFTEVQNTNLMQVTNGFVKFADLDNDSDMDLIVSGISRNQNGTIQKKVIIYTNDSSGIFTQVSSQPFNNDFSENICVDDIDGDNDLDIVLIHDKNNGDYFDYQLKIYTNNGSANFTAANNFSYLTPAFKPLGVTLADADRDGDLDLIVSGGFEKNNDYDFFTEILLNNGNGSFVPMNKTFFHDMSYINQLKTIDINSDGYDDIFMDGWSISGFLTAKIFINGSSGLSIDNGIENTQNIKIFPNPATNTLNVDREISTKSSYFVLMDVLGREVKRQRLMNSHIQLNVSNLPKGIYLWLIEEQGVRKSSGKVVIE